MARGLMWATSVVVQAWRLKGWCPQASGLVPGIQRCESELADRVEGEPGEIVRREPRGATANLGSVGERIAQLGSRPWTDSLALGDGCPVPHAVMRIIALLTAPIRASLLVPRHKPFPLDQAAELAMMVRGLYGFRALWSPSH
jgi:hypothetical protein